MPQVIKSPATKIVTKNGECELSITVEPIVIELKLHVTTDGNVSVNDEKVTALNTDESHKTQWAIPQFGTQKIQFGKSE